MQLVVLLLNYKASCSIYFISNPLHSVLKIKINYSEYVDHTELEERFLNSQPTSRYQTKLLKKPPFLFMNVNENIINISNPSHNKQYMVFIL